MTVVGVSSSMVLAISNATLLLSRCIGLGSSIQLLGALIRVVASDATLISSDSGLVIQRDSITSGPWGSVVVVVAIGLRGWSTVEVVSSRPWVLVSNMTVGVVGTGCRRPVVVRSRGITRRSTGSCLLVVARATLVHHSALAVLI